MTGRIALLLVALAALAACQGPPRERRFPPPRCLDGLPPAAAEPAAPLEAVPNVLWRRVVSQGQPGDLALGGDRLAVNVGSRLMLLERGSGNVVAVTGSTGYEGISGPVADLDGGFYFAGLALYAVDAEGAYRWIRPLTGHGASSPLLAPTGVLYSLNDGGVLHAVSATDGALLWTQPLSPLGPLVLRAGVGKTVLAVHQSPTPSPTLFDAEDGHAVGHLVVDDQAVHPAFVGVGGVVAQRFVDGPGPWPRLHIYSLDACGNVRFDLPPVGPQWPALVAPTGELIVGSRDAAEDSPVELSAYAPDGTRVVGPTRAAAPLAVGADGTIYGLRCPAREDTTSHTTLVAYSPRLEELWQLDLGPECPWGGPVLDDKGVLYYTTKNPDGGVVVAVQTTSPGPGGLWSVRRHDARGTRWAD